LLFADLICRANFPRSSVSQDSIIWLESRNIRASVEKAAAAKKNVINLSMWSKASSAREKEKEKRERGGERERERAREREREKLFIADHHSGRSGYIPQNSSFRLPSQEETIEKRQAITRTRPALAGIKRTAQCRAVRHCWFPISLNFEPPRGVRVNKNPWNSLI
jgi:hypothetical protein